MYNEYSLETKEREMFTEKEVKQIAEIVKMNLQDNNLYVDRRKFTKNVLSYMINRKWVTRMSDSRCYCVFKKVNHIVDIFTLPAEVAFELLKPIIAYSKEYSIMKSDLWIENFGFNDQKTIEDMLYHIASNGFIEFQKCGNIWQITDLTKNTN